MMILSRPPPLHSRQAEKALDANFLSIADHMLAEFGADKAGLMDRSRFHSAVAKGLLWSIYGSGNGKSFDTAFKVISVAEEYAVLRANGRHRTSQSLKRERGHNYDVLEITDSEGKPLPPIYFNVDLPYGTLERQRRQK